MILVKLATDFSRSPSAREEHEGAHSGVEFRKLLLPKVIEAIESKQPIVVDLDGTNGMGTSFLEEVFGGLIREEHIPYDDIKQYLSIISTEEPDLEDEVWDYIEDAHNEEKQ